MSLLPLMHVVDSESTELNSRLSFEAAPQLAAASQAMGTEVAEVMRDLGYSCCATSKCLGEVLESFGVLDAPCIGAIIAMMASTAEGLDDSLSLHGAFSTAVSGKYLEFDAKLDADKEDAVRALTSWNVDAFVEAIRHRAPETYWPAVFDHIDPMDYEIATQAGLKLLAAVHRIALGTPLPVTALLAPWRNAAGQLRAISCLLGARADVDMEWGAGTRVEARIPVGTARPDLAHWNCLELTGALLRLSTQGLYGPVHDIVAEAVSGCPQQLLAALLQMAPINSALETPLQAETLEQLLPLSIQSDSGVLKHMWELQPAAVMRGMVQLHAAQPQSLLRLLDLAQSFNALEQVLRLKPYSFTLDLAVVAQVRPRAHTYPSRFPRGCP